MSTTAGPRTTPRWVALAAVCMMLGAAPRPATAGPATETLRPAIDQVLRVLDDPALKGVEHARERRAALRAVMETVVDFPDAARR
jgi:hypothetical protein